MPLFWAQLCNSTLFSVIWVIQGEWVWENQETPGSWVQIPFCSLLAMADDSFSKTHFLCFKMGIWTYLGGIGAEWMWKCPEWHSFPPNPDLCGLFLQSSLAHCTVYSVHPGLNGVNDTKKEKWDTHRAGQETAAPCVAMGSQSPSALVLV